MDKVEYRNKLTKMQQHKNYSHLTYRGKLSKTAFAKEIARDLEVKYGTVLQWMITDENRADFRIPFKPYRKMIDTKYRKLFRRN